MARNSTDNEVLEFLRLVAGCNEAMKSLCQRLRQRPEVTQAIHWMHCPFVASDKRIEMVVGAEVSEQHHLLWEIIILFDGAEWFFESDVRITRRNGAKVFRELVPVYRNVIPDFGATLAHAAADLILHKI